MRTLGNFVLSNGVNICSVNLDRETALLTLRMNDIVNDIVNGHSMTKGQARRK